MAKTRYRYILADTPSLKGPMVNLLTDFKTQN